MGLWDTLLSTHAGSYNLAIGPKFAYVAQAVALNEYRSLFPSESIMARPQSVIPVAGQTRIERGFLGSHSDIGGSFADGDWSKVALVWMVNQATAAGVNMDSGRLDRSIIANPVLHDKSSNLFRQGGPAPDANSEDRVIRYSAGPAVRQRSSGGQGMTYDDTQRDNMISYSTNPRGNIAGTVDTAKYLKWLNDNGYGIGNMTGQ